MRAISHRSFNKMYVKLVYTHSAETILEYFQGDGDDIKFHFDVSSAAR